MITITGSSGFTLIEVLVAITILMIVLVPSVIIFQNSSRIIQKSTIKEKAVQLASEKLEELKARSVNQFLSSSSQVINLAKYPEFKRVVTISSCSANTQLKVVTVTVYWHQNSEKVRLITKIAERS